MNRWRRASQSNASFSDCWSVMPSFLAYLELRSGLRGFLESFGSDF
jgi:hypothetical protein